MASALKPSICAGIVCIFAALVPAQCPPGDLNHNCSVDLPDLVILAEQWLSPAGCQGHADDCADFIYNDGVNLFDFEYFTHAWGRHVPPVIINEFLASNNSRPPLDPGELLDEDGDSSDWIELFNLSGVPVDLSGWYLTIDPDHVSMWKIPEGVWLESGKFLVIFASNKNRIDPKKNLHTDFVLAREGSYLALLEADGVTLAGKFDGYEFAFQRFGFPPQETDISYGLFEDKERYFSRPTPGESNRDDFLGFVGSVQVSVERGIKTAPFDVLLTCDTSDAAIRYTIDGSNPTETNGTVFDPAKRIPVSTTTVLRAAGFKTGYKPSRTESHTYLFIDDVIQQSPDGEKPGDAWPEPYHENERQWIDYGMDPEVVNDPRYRDRIDDALLAIPSISITTDLENLFDPDRGIYVNAWNDGRAYERPCSMELIHPDGTEGFQVNAGLRIRGGFSRAPQNPKHAFRLFFREIYGDSNLNYPLFGEEGIDSFDKIDLRTAQNYSWSFRGSRGMDNGSKNTMCREVFSRDTQGEMGQPYTRSRYYHLYLNGQYWGLYQTQERPEARYGQDYLGGDSDDYDVMKVEAGWYTINPTDGNDAAYKKLWQAAIDGFHTDAAYYGIQGLNPDGTPNPEKEKLLDVDNLIDYMAVIYYTGNYDAPLSNFLGNRRPNNYYAMFNRETPDGWKFFCHDAEHSLFSGWDRTGPWEDPDLRKFSYFNPQWLHQQFCEHPEYRMRFADRIHKYFFNGGLLTPTKAEQRLRNRAEQIETAIIAESARWGDSKRTRPRTKDDDWQPEINRLYSDYFPYRTDEVLWQFIEDGWYPTTMAPSYFIGTRPQHGGMVYPPDNILNIVNPNITGTLYYTTDGSDPRSLASQSNSAFVPADSSAVPTTVVSSASPSVVTPPPPADAEFEILWITDTDLDAEFTDLLEDRDYSVQRLEMEMRGPLDPLRLEILNRADLIIVSSATLDISYDDPENWNSITAPLILMNASLARSNRWDWVDTTAAVSYEPTDLWTPYPEDPLFFGINMTGGNSVNVLKGNSVFVRTESSGYGDGLAFRIDEATPYLWIARWLPPGFWGGTDHFHWGTDQVVAGPRMLLSMGEGLYSNQPYNLTSDGKKLFLNAVEIMLSYNEGNALNFSPYVWAGWDQDILWPQAETELFGYIFDDGMLPDPNELTWEWTQLSGPGEVIFDPNSPDNSFFAEYTWGTYTYRFAMTWPKATFPTAGIYELQLAASDGEFTSTDTVTVRVLEPSASLVLDKSTRVQSRILGEDGIWSALNDATYGVGPVAESLRISEIMYHPDGDPNAEFIEVTNIGDESINLSWAAFTRGIAFTFPDIDLEPGEYVVAVRNLSAFEKRYGSDLPIAGQYAGNLDNKGETIALCDAVGKVIHQFKYSDNWHEITDGQGFSLTFRDPATPDMEAWKSGSAWRPSSIHGGSPGADDSELVPPPGTIVIHEVLAHSHDTASDWIELHNTTDKTIHIGGWFLSDNDSDDPNRMRFEIPDGVTIAGYGFKTFYQDTEFGNPDHNGCRIPFALSENGETVYLRSRLDAHGRFTGYFAKQSFDASSTGISIGRHVNSDHSIDFVALDSPTPNDTNAYPKVGPIVISEFHYHPTPFGLFDNEEYEFIELLNISSEPVTLQSFDNELNADLPWAFDEGIQYIFELETTILPGKRLLLAKNPDALMSRFTTIPEDVAVLRWTSGKLDNAGEKLQLAMPGDRVGTTRYYIPLETIRYSDSAPWPVSADGGGNSLHRKTPSSKGNNYGNDPARWSDLPPTPGQ